MNSPPYPPERVGTERLPVISAVLVDPVRKPTEYIVIADRGARHGSRRYATLRVYLWPDRVVAEHGEYDLTFADAQRSMLQRADLTTFTA